MGITRDTWIWSDKPMSDFRREEYEQDLERKVDAQNELGRVQEWVAAHRAKVLAMPIPRNECPGCFSAIYELAAADGWCWDCNPTRRKADRAGA
jgi:hypothetical protein